MGTAIVVIVVAFIFCFVILPSGISLVLALLGYMLAGWLGALVLFVFGLAISDVN